MKTNLFAVSVAIAVTLSIPARAVTIPGVFSTGVDNAGTPLAPGAIDPHYTITASPIGATTAKVTAPYFMWMGGTSSSAWINESGTTADSAAGDFVYSLTFSLAGLDHTTASITGGWASDNSSSIYLNGVYTGLARPEEAPFFDFASFTLDSGFAPGVNTLSFIVHNDPGAPGGNPSGLQVQIHSAVASVPEPGSLALLSLLGGSVLLRRKLKRN